MEQNEGNDERKCSERKLENIAAEFDKNFTDCIKPNVLYIQMEQNRVKIIQNIAYT